MKLSVTISGLTRLFGDDLAAILDVARAVDEAGVDQLVLPDHVVIGTRLDRYPFGRFPFGPEEPWLEPLTALAAFAGATERVRLSTGVVIAPLRPAVLLAKTAATLDVLSRGRLDLGVGTGWQPEEYEAAGVPFAGRAARMDDTIRACQALWTQDPPVSFSSPTVSFTEIWCEPRPLQPGGVPVWYGGGATEATARRVAELGAGWLPIGIMPDDELARGISLIRDACTATGRDPTTVGVRAGLAVKTTDAGEVDLDRTMVRVPALRELGVTVLSVTPARSVRAPGDIAPFLASLRTALADA
ncbi:MAG TPA: TIGR03619 family F420-dependent LLM class oxidoreductase [Acidimicrobiia bacterium]|nr:TIGR03619 family F420-dependent LLM class oxidoreductase [Acidimicrobiia bacterium]